MSEIGYHKRSSPDDFNKKVEGIDDLDINNDEFSPFINSETREAAEVLGGIAGKKLDFDNVEKNKRKAVIRIPWNYIDMRHNVRDHVIRQLPSDTSYAKI